MTPNKEYTVKPFSDEHVNPAAGIEAAVFSEPWRARALDDIFVHSDTVSALACETEDGFLAAYGGIECVLDEANIVNIATSPAYRRRGCATAVMSGLLLIASEKGCRRVTLEVREHNEAAQALYRSFGFEAVGVRKRFYSLPTEDALVMEKILDQTSIERSRTERH